MTPQKHGITPQIASVLRSTGAWVQALGLGFKVRGDFMTGLASAGGKAAITIPQNWVLVFEFGELKRKRKNPKDVWNMEARPNSTCPNLSKNSTSKPQTLNVLNDKTLQLPSGRTLKPPACRIHFNSFQVSSVALPRMIRTFR